MHSALVVPQEVAVVRNLYSATRASIDDVVIHDPHYADLAVLVLPASAAIEPIKIRELHRGRMLTLNLHPSSSMSESA